MEKTAKKPKTKTAKAPTKAPKRSLTAKRPKNMNTYSSLVYKSKSKRNAKKEREARKRAEDLASLPKEPWKRFLMHFHPKRVFRYWFSKRGLKTFGKIVAATILITIIAVGGLFLYFKKDIENIQLDDLNISDTVNVYLDRNGEVLWEDKGNSDYRLVVDGSEISTYMRQATVAIEDKNFYTHPGIDFWALVRAAASTLTGKGVQGGSTLTQQLIKQVYFSDESQDRGITGIPRKIKEAILALEIEKMYTKEEIITMYLNESPYGGRRNGVESAAQTYFGKSASELTLAESALLAAVPNNPAVLNPYNEWGHEALIARQHKVLNDMVDMGYISQEEADEAKEVAVLDTILPEDDQLGEIKAPHFVLEVKSYLEDKYGIATMRSGGFTITTSLDWRAQQIAEQAVATGAGIMKGVNNSDDIALASIDVETSQVIAMVGSSDWNAEIYGQVNAATSGVEPGSTIKPILDYGPLFMERDGQNYGPGSILKDENIDSIYCAGYRGTCALRNASGQFYGDLTIRQSLGNSLNIAAVKSLYINGIDNSLEIAHALGDKSYCSDAAGGLSVAIGSGCTVRLDEHANAFASISRGGVYKDLTYVLEIKNSSGEVIDSWKQVEGTRVYDEQVAYMVTNILSDASARSITFGSQATSFGFQVNNVKTASKTGTTTTTNSSTTKDSLMASYSPVVATVVWNGNHDGRGLSSSSNTVVRRVVNDYMSGVHLNVYQPDGRWTRNQDWNRPAGIQTLTVNGKTDIWPSWYGSSTSGTSKTTLTFNKFNHKLATECTVDSYKIDVSATKTIDPVTRQTIFYVPEPYKAEEKDDCSYVAPSVSLFSRRSAASSGSAHILSLYAVVTKGSADLASYELNVDGVKEESGKITGNTINLGYEITCSAAGVATENSVKLTVTDVNGASVTDSLSLTGVCR